MEKFRSISFKTFFENVNGVNIDIDFNRRKLTILSNKGEIRTTILFSKSIKNDFTVGDLFNQESKVGARSYYVYQREVENLYYLWYGVILDVF